MARAERPRGACPVCSKDCAITDEGGVRHHFTDDSEQQAGPDSRKCRGVGQPPAGVKEEPASDDLRFLCRVPSGPEGCGHQVQLTANRRARSHLTPQGTPCAEGGSAFPLAVGPDGYRADTAEWTEEDWERVFPRPTLGNDARNATVTPKAVETIDLPHDRQSEPDAEPCPYCKDALYEDLDYHIRNEHPTRPDPHQREADAAIAEVERIQSEEDIAYETSVRDGLEESRRRTEDVPGRVTMELTDDGAGLFDPTHVLTTAIGPEIHPGEAGDCRLPGCCTHPQGFVYGDDGHGHSGSVCMICGGEEPEPVPGPDDWKTPDDILQRMPEGVRRTAQDNPECWLCGHEVTPLAESFEPSGNVRNVVWTCRIHCAHGDGHIGIPCRPRLASDTTVGELERGDCFVRHITRGDGLVFRTEAVTEFCVQATVIGTGRHAGRTGELTNLTEEVTCTDQHGAARPRRDHATGGTSPSSPVPSPQPSIPSAPAPTERPRTPAPKPDRSSTPATTASASTATSRSTRATSSGASAPATPASSSTPSATTNGAPVADAFSTPKAAKSDSDRYDRYGRYKLTHPDSPKKKVNWTRATTFAKSIQDTFALSQWAQRMTLKGATLRPDIVAAAGTLEVKADKDRLNTLVDDAKKAAGDKVAANLGTAIHTYTERHDKGQPTQAPEEHQPAVDAYASVLASFGLEPVPGLIEFTTAVKQYEIAGTSDRCYRVTRDITIDLNGRPVTLYAGEYVIGDVKTGADLSYGWQEIAIQLAIYAQGLNTSGVWDWGTGTWSRPVDPDQPGVQIQVRTDVGVVPHLPVDRERTGAPLATLYAVDISAGWAAAVLCASVREWRRSSKLAVPLQVADLAPEAPRASAPAAASRPPAPRPAPEVTDREPTLEDRAQAVRNRAEASAVYQAATAAKVTVVRLNALVKTMQDKLKSHVEQGA